MNVKRNIIAEFKICYTSFLDETGTCTQPLPACLDDTRILVSMYETMVLTRLFDKQAIALQRTGRLGTYPSVYGQEAIGVAIGKMMHSDDVFCPYYREYGGQLLRGVKMEEILAYWGGDERGSCFEQCREDFPFAIPIASQVLHATGIATAMKLRKQTRCTVTAIGDGGTSEGDFYEAINLAGTWCLPIVYVINNNQWAISLPRCLQTSAKTLAQKGIISEIHSEQVDGNDIIALSYALDNAIKRARAGKGPSIIEALTYRLGDHTTADDAKRYRNETEVTKACEKEPIKRLKNYLCQQGLWDDQKEQRLIKQTQADVDEAVNRYLHLSPQLPESMFDNLYETLPESLEAQRNDLLENPSS